MQVRDVLLIENRVPSYYIPTLLDTGAALPTWLRGYRTFAKTFPDYVDENAKAVLAGFGGDGEIAPVYRIPRFMFGDVCGNTVVFRDMPVVVTERNFQFDMVLSFTLFRKINVEYVSYKTDESGNYCELNPRIRFFPHKEEYYVGARYLPVTRMPEGYKTGVQAEKLLTGVYVFSQKPVIK